MKTAKITFTILFAVLSFATQQARAFSINFDYTYDTAGFFTTEAKTTLAQVSTLYGSLITTELSAIQPSGSNMWNMDIANPVTQVDETIYNPTVAANTVTIFVGGSDLGQLGLGGPGGLGGTGNVAWIETILYRGVPGAKEGMAASPWGGTISFNNSTNWNFSLDNPTPLQLDFYSVALHEVAHVLGIGTSAAWQSFVRSGNQFIGPASTAANDGTYPGLNTANDHWNSSLTSINLDGNLQQPAMSPQIMAGQRKTLTQLDLAGLTDVGWTVVTPVPEPEVATLIALGLLATILVRYRNQKGSY